MGDLSREPSMEDILSSIRRVIARDEAPGARETVLAAESDDVLDLDEQESEDDVVPAIPTEEELVSAASADAARQSLDDLRSGRIDRLDASVDDLIAIPALCLEKGDVVEPRLKQ